MEALLEEIVDIKIESPKEKPKIPVGRVSVEKAEKLAKRFGVDLKELKFPNYSEQDFIGTSYLRFFKDLNVVEDEIKVLTGRYCVQKFIPILDSKVVGYDSETTYFCVKIKR